MLRPSSGAAQAPFRALHEARHRADPRAGPATALLRSDEEFTVIAPVPVLETRQRPANGFPGRARPVLATAIPGGALRRHGARPLTSRERRRHGANNTTGRPSTTPLLDRSDGRTPARRRLPGTCRGSVGGTARPLTPRRHRSMAHLHRRRPPRRRCGDTIRPAGWLAGWRPAPSRCSGPTRADRTAASALPRDAAPCGITTTGRGRRGGHR